MSLLSIRDLRVAFRVGREGGQGEQALRRLPAVGRPAQPATETTPFAPAQGISLDIEENTTVGLVGESGSGKSVTAMSILRLLPDNAEVSGDIRFQGIDLLNAQPGLLRTIRGRRIACIFQDPMGSLNPVHPVGRQVAEPLRYHLGLSRRAAMARVLDLFMEVGLPDPRRRLDAYPHELSGGQQQRVMIAMALACEPQLLIADEPTTALDVTVQRQILELLARLKEKHHMSMLFISHDLGLVGEIADQVAVMRHGQLRETGSVGHLFTLPQDPYTRALLACRPSLAALPRRLPVIDQFMAAEATSGVTEPGTVPAGGETSSQPAAAPAAEATPAAPVEPGVEPAPLLKVDALHKRFSLRGGWRKREFHALKGVSLSLARGRTLGVVGESGSGKTTLGLTLLRLHEPSSGRIEFDGAEVTRLGGSARQTFRRRAQIVFQNPYASLNPRFTIGQALMEPMRIHGLHGDDAAREQAALALLRKVGLTEAALGRYPHEFSGGQRQRIAIARALALQPELLVLDEAVSALDVSVQAQVLNLLRDLQDELGLAYVFISHDLAVVRFMADEVMVMKDGEVVEMAEAAALLDAPQTEYTRRLLEAVPRGHLNRPAAPAGTADPAV